MQIAITADLHWGTHADGDVATRKLLADLRSLPVDLLILAGDQGAGEEIEQCLQLFAELPCQKALIAGNHDLWVRPDDSRGDSMKVFEHELPELCRQYGFHNLDHEPLLFPQFDLAVVGTVNWYDYSWTDKVQLANFFPDWEDRLKTKRFVRGRHNDDRFIRWNTDDAGFTRRCVDTLKGQLTGSLSQVDQVIVVAHHPPLRQLQFPRVGLPTADGLLWDAFSGNQAMEDLLIDHASHIPFVFCGHTHRARFAEVQGMQCYNVGSDYGFKRLLRLDWPAKTATETQFDA